MCSYHLEIIYKIVTQGVWGREALNTATVEKINQQSITTRKFDV